MTIECERSVELLTQSADSENAAERRIAADHAATCSSCRSAVEAVQYLRAEGLSPVPRLRAEAFAQAVDREDRRAGVGDLFDDDERIFGRAFAGDLEQAEAAALVGKGQPLDGDGAGVRRRGGQKEQRDAEPAPAAHALTIRERSRPVKRRRRGRFGLTGLVGGPYCRRPLSVLEGDA